jgi:hypothetical protein
MLHESRSDKWLKLRHGTLQGRRLLRCQAELEGTVETNLLKIDLIQSPQDRFHCLFF